MDYAFGAPDSTQEVWSLADRPQPRTLQYQGTRRHFDHSLRFLSVNVDDSTFNDF